MLFLATDGVELYEKFVHYFSNPLTGLFISTSFILNLISTRVTDQVVPCSLHLHSSENQLKKMTLIPEAVQDLNGKVVLVIWGPGNSPQALQQLAEDLKSRNTSHVVVENVDRLTLCIIFVNHYF